MTDEKRLWPRFSPEINFGHLLQAAVLLVTMGGGDNQLFEPAV